MDNPERSRECECREALEQLGLGAVSVRWLAETDSTMDEARRDAQQLAVGAFALVVAEAQKGGRGRQGRVWSSHPGGLYMTISHRTELPVAKCAGWSLAVGCALHFSLTALDVSVGLKWPNDLLSADGRKLAGTLVETASAGADTVVYTGIGMNVTNELFDDSVAARLADLIPAPPALPPLAATVCAAVVQTWGIFGAAGFAPFRSEWDAAAVHRGRTVAVDTGSEVISGMYAGTSEIGELLIDTGAEIRSAASGHVVAV